MLKKQRNSQPCTEDNENKLIIEKWMKRNSSNNVTIGQNVEKSDDLERMPSNISVSKSPSKCDIKVSEKKKVVIPVEISDDKSNNLIKLKKRHRLPFYTDESNAPKTKFIRQSLPCKSTSLHNDESNGPKAKIVRQSLPSSKGTSLSTFKTSVSANSINRTPKLSNEKKPSIEVISTKTGSRILPKMVPKSTKSPSKTIPIIEVIKTTNNIIGNEVNVSTPVIKSNIVKSMPAAKGNQIVKTLSPLPVKCNVIEVSPSPIGIQVAKHLSPSTVKCNAVNTSPHKKVGVAGSENNVGIANNAVTNLLQKKEDEDVYISLLENYRYLVTPKSWSVNEFTNETRNRYVVFFNTQVIEDKGILISAMKKSLIIDKGGTMNYSVHGLPVDIERTILPKTLDNTKKLLSILHIFDKMQVCEGLGSDLNVVQNRVIFKDCCRYWRHINCKIILIKATRCSVCTETRNELKTSSEPLYDPIKQEIEFVDVTVKTEEDF